MEKMKVLKDSRRTAANQTGKLARGASELRNDDEPNTTQCKQENKNRRNLQGFQFLKNALQMNGGFAGGGCPLMAGSQAGETQNIVTCRNTGEEKTDSK